MGTLSGQTIGFVGLGLMGKPMSRNLQRAGAKLVIHNRSRGAVDKLAKAGMTPAMSPREVAEKAEAVVLMVIDTPAVEQVLLGPGGVIEGLRRGQLVIDMGTTLVSATRRFAERVVKAGGDYVDAPVSGGQVGAEAATLTIMAGGSAAAFARAKPLFEAMGKHITHVGAVGAGQVAKMTNQVIVALTIGAVSEGLALAKRAGVEPGKVREAIMGGFAHSRILELHGKRMVEGNFTPGGRARTQRKDITQGEQLAREVGIERPMLELAGELYDRLIAAGHGDLDHSALYKLYDK